MAMVRESCIGLLAPLNVMYKSVTTLICFILVSFHYSAVIMLLFPSSRLPEGSRSLCRGDHSQQPHDSILLLQLGPCPSRGEAAFALCAELPGHRDAGGRVGGQDE